MIIPYQELSPEALLGLIEEYVTRDGTDYGEHDASLESKVEQVKTQLSTGIAFILFDPDSQSCNIIHRDDLTPSPLKNQQP